MQKSNAPTVETLREFLDILDRKQFSNEEILSDIQSALLAQSELALANRAKYTKKKWDWTTCVHLQHWMDANTKETSIEILNWYNTKKEGE